MVEIVKRLTAILLTIVLIACQLTVAVAADTEFINADFEKSTNGFKVRGTATVVQSTKFAHSGSGSLEISQRGSESWHSTNYDLTDYVTNGGSYKISAWVYIPEDVPATKVVLSFELNIDGTKSYPWLDGGNQTIEPGEWTELVGTYTFPETGDIKGANFNIETDANGVGNTYYVDDVSFAVTGNTPVPEIEAAPEPEVDQSLASLKDVYANEFLIGNVFSARNKAGVDYEILVKHHNAVTPENFMKPDALQPTEGNFNFTTCDDLVDWAENEGLKIIGHTFVWHQQTPGWMASSGEREKSLEQMKNHISTVAGRYKGRIYSWDVVNEAIGNTTNPDDWRSCLRETKWLTAIGDDYIEQAFRFAAEADPNAELYYNDYNLDDPLKAQVVYNMVKELKEKGVKIDGIGMQGHYNSSTSPVAVEKSIQLFASLGVKVSITELDVSLANMESSKLSKSEEISQARTYAALFKVFKDNADVIDRVTIWGCDDGTSWRADKYPLLFDKYYRAKESYHAVVDPEGYLEAHKFVASEAARTAIAANGTPVIDGEIDAVWSNSPEFAINNYATAWSGATADAKALWDENYVYILFEVDDAVLSDKSEVVHEQDSVEMFLDENNGKTPYYEEDDAQYRVSYKNNQSFGTNAATDNFITAVKETNSGYIVEAAVPFRTIKGAAGMYVGFEVQVNDDSKGEGTRDSIAKFCDLTDFSYNNTEKWGQLGLADANGIFTENTGDATPDTPAVEVEGDIKVVLNGNSVLFDVVPVINNGSVMVPMRKIFSELGASVSWDNNKQTITSVKDGSTVQMQIGTKLVRINDKVQTLVQAPMLVDGRTLVPLRAVAEAMNCNVEWNEGTKTVTIDLPGKE